MQAKRVILCAYFGQFKSFSSSTFFSAIVTFHKPSTFPLLLGVVNNIIFVACQKNNDFSEVLRKCI